VLDPIAEDREYTFTRDFIAERTATMLDPRNPWWSFLRQLNLPGGRSCCTAWSSACSPCWRSSVPPPTGTA